MEQEKNLKEEIVVAVNSSLRLFRDDVKKEFGGGIKNLEAKMDAGFRAVDARFQGADSQMRGQGVLLEKMQGDIDILVEGQEVLNGQVDRLDGRMGCVEDTLDRMEIKLDVLADDVKKKVDKAEVNALGLRVAHLEA